MSAAGAGQAAETGGFAGSEMDDGGEGCQMGNMINF